MSKPQMISIDQGEIPEYVKNRPDLGRSLWLCAHYEHGCDQWTVYIPQGTGPLFVMHPLGMSEGSYLSVKSQCDDDFCDPLASLAYQHLSFPKMIPVIECLVSDILAGLSTLHNYFILVDHGRRHNDARTRSVIATTIESSLTIHRSFYDLLNRVVQKTVEVSNIKGVKVPDSYRKVLDQGAQGMTEKYQFPPAIVNYYLSREKVFRTLRSVRDQVVHHGKSPQLIFRFDDGFGINREMGISASLNEIGVWHPESLRENGIGVSVASTPSMNGGRLAVC